MGIPPTGTPQRRRGRRGASGGPRRPVTPGAERQARGRHRPRRSVTRRPASCRPAPCRRVRRMVTRLCSGEATDQVQARLRRVRFRRRPKRRGELRCPVAPAALRRQKSGVRRHRYAGASTTPALPMCDVWCRRRWRFPGLPSGSFPLRPHPVPRHPPRRACPGAGRSGPRWGPWSGACPWWRRRAGRHLPALRWSTPRVAGPPSAWLRSLRSQLSPSRPPRRLPSAPPVGQPPMQASPRLHEPPSRRSSRGNTPSPRRRRGRGRPFRPPGSRMPSRCVAQTSAERRSRVPTAARSPTPL